MTVLKERFDFLTIELGFTLSYVSSVLWGIWSFQNGFRGLLSPATEEDVVSRFGPHFREGSYIANGVASFFAGGPIVNQTYALSYMLFEGCVDFCDVFVGSCMMLAIPLFFLLFWKQYSSNQKDRPSPSSLKGRLKIWLAAWLFGCCFYFIGFTADAGNIILTLPPEAHAYGESKILLRYLLVTIPSTHILFSILWYRKLREETQDGAGNKKGRPSSFFSRCNEICSVTSFGWHIFWMVFLLGFMGFYLTFMMIDLRTIIVEKGP